MNRQTMIGRGRRIHYSTHTSARRVLGKVKAFAVQGHIEQTRGNQPYGLWYAFEEGWVDWVRDNRPTWMVMYTAAIEIDISRCNILVLDTQDKVLDFTLEYRYNPPAGEDPNYDAWGQAFAKSIHIRPWDIDWVRVAEEYDGIEINPYIPGVVAYFDKDAGLLSSQYDAELVWYSALSIPSGCIWNVDKIIFKEVER